MPINGIPPGNRPPGRRPSLRGVLMSDIVKGQSRVRAWPRKRKSTQHPDQVAAAKKFANAQFATKFMAPQMVADFASAVQGTPLLPRDLLTSMLYGRLAAFVLEDGKVRYPMPARIDVSQSLDALGNTPGMTLIRREDYWEAIDASAQSAIGVSCSASGPFSASPGGVYVPFSWTEPLIDQGPFWNPLDPTLFTVPSNGWYLADLSGESYGAGGQYRALRMRLNGTQSRTASQRPQNTTANSWLAMQAIFFAQAGDVIDCLGTASNATGQWRSMTFNLIRI